MEDSPLSDLSFLKFPDLTGEVVRNIFVLIALLVMVVVVTVVVQRWLHGRQISRRERITFARLAGQYGADHIIRNLLKKMLPFTELMDPMALVRDSLAFERAAAQIVSRHDSNDIEQLALVRRTFHLNVMNPNLTLVSTRQLTPDLPVRVVTRIGGEIMDVYCALLRLDEEFFMLDLPQEAELLDTLAGKEGVQLIFWREAEGETVFDIHLERLELDQMTVLRSPHVLRSESLAQRKDFRLTVEQPLKFTFLTAAQLSRHQGGGASGNALQGEGQLVNLSFGGASFVTSSALEPLGMAQIFFPIHGQGVRAMLELVQVNPLGDGRYLARGRFRSLPDDARNQLNGYLYREQIKRLKEKDVIKSG